MIASLPFLGGNSEENEGGDCQLDGVCIVGWLASHLSLCCDYDYDFSNRFLTKRILIRVLDKGYDFARENELKEKHSFLLSYLARNTLLFLLFLLFLPSPDHRSPP
jgi:hypothetical protein